MPRKKIGKKLVVMIPAFNEEKTIAKVIKRIPKRIEGISKVEVVVIDDGSKDNTAKIAKKAGADFVIRNKGNIGLAASFKKGLLFALERNADIIVNIDADNQYDAIEIKKLVKPIVREEADITLGVRQIDKLDFMPLGKKLGNKIASFVVSILSGRKFRDAQTGFRAFSREAAAKINVLSNYTYTQETLIQAVKKKLKIKEIDVGVRDRRGKSRLISSIFSYAKRAGATILLTYLNYRPLKTFLLIASLVVFIGLIVGTRVILHYLSTGQVTPYVPSAILTSLLIIVGFQIIVIALFAEMIRENRQLTEEILYEMRVRKKK